MAITQSLEAPYFSLKVLLSTQHPKGGKTHVTTDNGIERWSFKRVILISKPFYTCEHSYVQGTLSYGLHQLPLSILLTPSTSYGHLVI